MKGGKNKQPLGYTIIEVMIVLAVSGLMFIIAAGFINGKSQQASFASGTNQLTSHIQDVIEQVSDGKYSDIPLHCVKSGSNKVQFAIPAGNSQGNNQDCVFLGKFIHFRVNKVQNKYEIFSLVNLKDATSLIGTTPVTPYLSGSYNGYELTTGATIPQSLNVKSVKANDVIPAIGFGFVQSQGINIGGTGYVSGGQTISLIYEPSLPSPNDQPDEATAANYITGRTPVIADSIKICITDGSRYAEILLGGKDTNNSHQSHLIANVHQLGSTAC